MNDTAQGNHLYQTNNFQLASWLQAKGIIYVRTEWPTPKEAVFFFRQPPDEILSAWQRGDDSVSARALYDAMDFLRDELHKRGNRYG